MYCGIESLLLRRAHHPRGHVSSQAWRVDHPVDCLPGQGQRPSPDSLPRPFLGSSGLTRVSRRQYTSPAWGQSLGASQALSLTLEALPLSLMGAGSAVVQLPKITKYNGGFHMRCLMKVS